MASLPFVAMRPGQGQGSDRIAVVNPTQLGVPEHGPRQATLFQSPPDPPRQSAEQGIGRSPGQEWAHMPHVEQHNPASLTNIGWHDGPPQPMAPERQGWSIPRYFEQYAEGKHVWPVPVAISNPQTRSYTGLAEVTPTGLAQR